MAGMPELCRLPWMIGSDLFAVLVAERDLGAEQIRSADVAAAQVGAVAAGAADAVERLAAFDLAGSSGGRCCPGTKPPRPPPPRRRPVREEREPGAGPGP